MAFGALRKAYSAKCNFFADDSSLSNRINWYIVPDDRQVFADPTVFFPRSDQSIPQGLSPFEQNGIGAIVRQKNDGFDTYGYPGTHVHGDSQDFLGQSPSHKYWIGMDPPVEPCMGVPRGRAPLELFSRATLMPRGADTFIAPVALQAWLDDAFLAPISLACDFPPIKRGVQVFHAAVTLQGGNVAATSHVATFDASLKLACGDVKPFGPVQEFAAGLELAAGNLATAGGIQLLDAALALDVDLVPTTSDAILMESSGYVLQETGFKILME